MIERLPRSLAVLSLTACVTLPAAASHAHHASASHAAARHAATSHAVTSHGKRARYGRVAAVHREPAPAMDPTRATEIQSALIRAGYLAGEPTGVWDAESVAAMQKLQDANGWQTKYTPDSRALVKLGLGAAAQPAQRASTVQPGTAADAPPLAPLAPLTQL